MCTLVILHRVHDRYPLIVAANRDEFYERPSQGPDLLQTLPLAVLAPKDLQRGGTWLGAGQGGWFVGLTNQDDGTHEEGKLSRGDVVTRCLLTSDHRSAAKLLASLDPNDYNPFNLVFGRVDAMFLSRVHRAGAVELEPIPEGITVVSNDCAGNAYRRKENHAGVLASHVDPGDTDIALLRKLGALLADHSHGRPNPYQSLCVHDDARGFGTRSSSIITFTQDGDVTYYHSEGQPCRSEGFTFCRRLYNADFSDLEPEWLSDEDVRLDE